MTIQITYNKPDHSGNYGRRIHIETFCTNENRVLAGTQTGLKIIEVLIEKFRTVLLKERKKEKVITEQLPMQRHDWQSRGTEQEMNRLLYVLLDDKNKTLFASLDLSYIVKKAKFLDAFPAEAKKIKRIF